MRRIFTIALPIVLLTASNAAAINIAVITTPPGALNVALCLCAIVCSVVGFKVFSVVKGGLLGRSWQLIGGAFAIFAATQLAGLLDSLEIFTAPDWLVPAGSVVMAAIFLFALFEAKKVLS